MRQGKVGDLVWSLVFKELSNEEMLQLSYEIVLCSFLDQDCREGPAVHNPFGRRLGYHGFLKNGYH